jgi:hypothetical protein
MLKVLKKSNVSILIANVSNEVVDKTTFFMEFNHQNN